MNGWLIPIEFYGFELLFHSFFVFLLLFIDLIIGVYCLKETLSDWCLIDVLFEAELQKFIHVIELMRAHEIELMMANPEEANPEASWASLKAGALELFLSIV